MLRSHENKSMTDKPKPILIDIRAVKLLLDEKSKPKTISWDYLAKRCEQLAPDGASYEDYQRVVALIRTEDAVQFTTPDDGPPLEKLSASERLEKVNREAATKFKAREQAPSKLILTDAEREKVAKMSADEKHAFANRKNKEASDVKKS